MSRRLGVGGCALLLVAATIFGVRAGQLAGRAMVTVEWQTASELNTAGFNLYRADRTGGPLTRVNATLIPAASDPLAGSRYVFTDTAVVAGRHYAYTLEDVDTDGATLRHGPIEVDARSGGLPEAVVSAVFGLCAVGGLWALWWRRA